MNKKQFRKYAEKCSEREYKDDHLDENERKRFINLHNKFSGEEEIKFNDENFSEKFCDILFDNYD